MENSINIQNIEKTYLFTDNQLIANEARDLDIKVIFKSGDFTSGTDRIANSISLILEDLKYQVDCALDNLYIINIQADQPFIDKNLITQYIHNINLMGKPELVTSYYNKEYKKSKYFHDEVKLITSTKSRRVLYFSRSMIPFIKSLKNNDIKQYEKILLKYHIGIYAYRFDILQSWINLSSSELEKYESLEQLRWLDYDIPIYAFRYNNEVLSIDNRKQLEHARNSID